MDDITQLNKMEYVCDYLTDQMQYINEKNLLTDNVVNEDKSTDIDNSFETYNSNVQKKPPTFDGSSSNKASSVFSSIRNDMMSSSAYNRDIKRQDMLETSSDVQISDGGHTSLNVHDPNTESESTKCIDAGKNEHGFKHGHKKYKLPTLSDTNRTIKISEGTNELLERSRSLSKLTDYIKPKTNLFRDFIAPKAVTRSLSDVVSGVVNDSPVPYTGRTSVGCSSGYDSFDELSDDDECAAICFANENPEVFDPDKDRSYKEKERCNTSDPVPPVILSKIKHNNISYKKKEMVGTPNRYRKKIASNIRQEVSSDDCASENSDSECEGSEFTRISPFQRFNVLPEIKCHTDSEGIDEKKRSTRITLDISTECLSDSHVRTKGKKQEKKVLNRRRKKITPKGKR